MKTASTRRILQRDMVIVVNERDEPLLFASKDDAHRDGSLHRALSIFITNEQGELLLQQRAAHKYHSGGLWSNTCCSHPAPDEPTADAAHRRLQEELGFDTELSPIGTLRYRAAVGPRLIEHELDHLFTGSWSGTPRPAPDEVDAVKWISPEALESWMLHAPHQFTAWFPILLQAWRERSSVNI